MRQVTLAPYAHAAMHAAHSTNQERAVEVASLLGVSRHHASALFTRARELAGACEGLKQAGIDVGGGPPNLTMEAAAIYTTTP